MIRACLVVVQMAKQRTWQERCQHEPRLAENDAPQDQVGGRPVLRHDFREVLVQVEDEADERCTWTPAGMISNPSRSEQALITPCMSLTLKDALNGVQGGGGGGRSCRRSNGCGGSAGHTHQQEQQRSHKYHRHTAGV